MESLQYTDTLLMFISAIAAIASLIFALFFKGRLLKERSRLVEQSTVPGEGRRWWYNLVIIVAVISAVIALLSFILKYKR